MSKNWFEQRSTTRRLRLLAMQIRQLPFSHARGVERLLAQLNEGLRDGNLDQVAQLNDKLARFLEESAMAYERATAAQAHCFPPSTSQSPESEEPLSAPAHVDAPCAPPILLPTLGFAAEPQLSRYVVSSTTLAEAHAYLTQHRPGSRTESEFMLAATGLVVDGARTLEHLIEVKMSHQSFGQASFDMQAFMTIAVSLYEHDQHLHAVFHSHRFDGPPSPSDTDIRLQGILEEGGYPAIQAVFSEDGYVRFFANQRLFGIEIHGSGVEPVDGHPNTFHILQFNTLPHPTVAAAARGRSDGVRPL